MNAEYLEHIKQKLIHKPVNIKYQPTEFILHINKNNNKKHIKELHTEKNFSQSLEEGVIRLTDTIKQVEPGILSSIHLTLNGEEKEEKKEKQEGKEKKEIQFIDKTQEGLETFRESQRPSIEKNKSDHPLHFRKHQLLIEHGILGDGHIVSIELLRRADTNSYARQNGLLPNKWIDIHFNGDYPFILTGKITNLEEDMIEITTHSNEVLYINFHYKGIPEDLLISKIVIRPDPTKETEGEKKKELEEGEIEESGQDPLDLEEGELEDGELEQGELDLEEEEFEQGEQIRTLLNPVQVKNNLKKIYINADAVVFGQKMDSIKIMEDVDEQFYCYSIKTQIDDFLDDLLSNIPTEERTPMVLQEIHLILSRYKQLRETFSTFDKNHFITGFVKKDANYKPLTKWLQDFNFNLYWLLPVSSSIRYRYDEATTGTYNAHDNEYENTDTDDIRDIITKYQIPNMKELEEYINRQDNFHATNNYAELQRVINPYFIPYNTSYFTKNIEEYNENPNFKKMVNANIHSVNCNNNDNMYSSVVQNCAITSKRFLISKYVTGTSKLETIHSTSQSMTTERKQITPNETMLVNSILTLPEPTIRFSKINLPGTHLLERANLNQSFLYYWKLLTKKTLVSQVMIDSLEENQEFEFNEQDYVNGFRNYKLAFDNPQNWSKDVIYQKYIHKIIPKTKILFRLMRKYIKSKLSLVDVIRYLEPFLIYNDDLTFTQVYSIDNNKKNIDKITNYIDYSISQHNKTLIQKANIMKMFMQKNKYNKNTINNINAFGILHLFSNAGTGTGPGTGTGTTGLQEVIKTYDLSSKETNFTNSELLLQCYDKDNLRLYTSAISLYNLRLMFSHDVVPLLEKEQQQNNEKINNDKDKDKCPPTTIAKLYYSVDQLQQDNDATIYFDKKYDNTYYGIMEIKNDKGGYLEQVMTLSSDKLIAYISMDKMKKGNLSESDATYLAQTLVDGIKRVVDGQYAVVLKGYDNMEDQFEKIKEVDYYVRKNNKWVLDNSVKQQNQDKNTDDNSLLCNLQETCVSIKEDTCNLNKTEKFNLKNQLIKKILEEFDAKYKMSNELFHQMTEQHFQYYKQVMEVRNKIRNYNFTKYNNTKYKLSGLNINDPEPHQLQSPYLTLLNLILKQSDLEKQYYYLIKFCNKYTRPYQEGSFTQNVAESEHWLYCVKTHTKLLPKFKYDFALSFIEDKPQYKEKIEEIISKIGTAYDDMYVDKYTGWNICQMTFDNSDEYMDGYKVSKEIVEEDVEETLEKLDASNEIIQFLNKNMELNNMIQALSISMGINMESQKVFIINSVNDIMANENIIKSKKSYQHMYETNINKGKKTQRYEEYYNMSLLLSTCCVFLLAIQTSIPPIKTRKTMPGCVRSFTGYPFEKMSEDTSSLTYMACVLHNMKDAGEPWNVLKRNNVETIALKLKMICDEIIKQFSDANNPIGIKIQEKTHYLLHDATVDEIPTEHDITSWSEFLPPQIPFHFEQIVSVSQEVKDKLKGKLRNGEMDQYALLSVFVSKMEKFALGIQERIQHIVEKNSLLLRTESNVFYIENACCNGNSNESSLSFFVQKDATIEEYNTQVQILNNYIQDIHSYQKAILFCSKANTKIKHSVIPNTFDEKTIYIAFIHYCKFKSTIPIPSILLPLCKEKPVISQNDTTTDMIIKDLNKQGIGYKYEDFSRLLQLIGRENHIFIQPPSRQLSCFTKLMAYIRHLNPSEDDNEEDDKTKPKPKPKKPNPISEEEEFITLTTHFFQHKEVNRDNIIELFNFLSTHTDDMMEKIQEFFDSSRLVLKEKRVIRDILVSWNTWKMLDKSNPDAIYNIIEFYKTYISNMVSIFPSIILNGVNYEDIDIHEYFKFSTHHVEKLTSLVSDYFMPLTSLYEPFPDEYKPLLSKCMNDGKKWMQLSQSTPCFKNAPNESDKEETDVICILLFEFYILKSIMCYIDVATESQPTANNVNMNQANMAERKEHFAKLLYAYMITMNNEKNKIDVNYEFIRDKIFKEKEKEKNSIRNRLENQGEEFRQMDNEMKKLKLGDYAKGQQKGLRNYDPDYYDSEFSLRIIMNEDEMNKDNEAFNNGLDTMERINEVEENEELEVDDDEYDDADEAYEQYADNNDD